jgi:hypothetical protein
MTNIHWSSAIDGAFNNGADWTGGVAPRASDDAILDATGAPYKVTSSADATVNGLQLAANATLAIAAGTFTATAGTDGGANAGTITVTGGAVFQTGGVVDNSGGITLSGAGSDLRLVSDTTLTGGGVVSARYGAYGNYTQILGAGPVTLTNLDNTIIGAGQIGGSAGFSLVNEAGGVIEADLYQRRLILGSSNDPGEQIVNNGLIIAAAGARSPSSFLEIDHASVSGVGTIAVGANSNVTILYSHISGQTLSIASGGVFDLIRSRVVLGGTLVNPSLLKLDADVSKIRGGLTLSGAGEIDIRGGRVVGTKASTTLVNEDNKIVLFKGNLGAGTLTLINEAHGTIVCEGTIDTGSRKITNAGLIESGPNYRRIPGVIMSAIDNSGTLSTGVGGTLVVNGAVTGSGQALIDSEKFSGGVLDFTSSFSENVTFLPQSGHDGVGVLELAQSQTYAATITGFSKRGKTSLDLGDLGYGKASSATYSGTKDSGVLTVTDGTHTAHITLIGDFLAATFVASSDGQGGTSVVANAKDAPSAPAFVSAMAGLGGRSAAAIHAPAHLHADVRHYLLGPRVQIA